MRNFFCLTILCFAVMMASAQRFSLLIKGGHVIDPKNHVNDTMDIGIADGKIKAIGKSIDPLEARRVIDAKGMYVVPGFIDIHTHVFYGSVNGRHYCDGLGSAVPDSFTFKSGITTVVDAGSSGWRNFPLFAEKIIATSKTRVLAFLNIVGSGMRGGEFEHNLSDMQASRTAAIAKKFSRYIVGIKVAHYDLPRWFPVDEAEKAARMAGIPVMIDFGSSSPPLSIDELFQRHLRSGDIFTHCFAELPGRETIVSLMQHEPRPFIANARKKGIEFDVGYGMASFDFRQAVPAIKYGFYPNSISTDMQRPSAGDSVKDLLNIMSKFLALGMKLPDVIAACTVNPAKEIGHEELGQLPIGGDADLTILAVQDGKYNFFDHNRDAIAGSEKVECRLTVRDGKVVYSNRELSRTN